MKTAFLLAAALAGMLGTAGAQSLVNMDVNYGGTSTNFINNATTATGNYNYANPTETDTVDSTAFGSIPSGNLFGAGASLGGTSVVHTSWQLVANGTAAGTFPTSAISRISASGVSTGGTNDVRVAVTQNTIGGGATSASMAFDMYVAKADLLGGYASVSNLTLQGLSFSINIGFLHSSVVGGATSNVYFMIENGSQWYVSATSKSSTGAFSLSNASTATWYAYDPTSNLLFNSASPGTGVLGSTFSDIQAFGALGQTTNFDPTASQTSTIAAITSFYGFQVTQAPEPSPLLLIGVGGAVLAVVAAWRRRARVAC